MPHFTIGHRVDVSVGSVGKVTFRELTEFEEEKLFLIGDAKIGNPWIEIPNRLDTYLSVKYSDCPYID